MYRMDNTEITLTDMVNAVGEFHRAFGVKEIEPGSEPGLDMIRLRISLQQEELLELVDALYTRQGGLVFDALLDNLWLILGTARCLGMSEVLAEGFMEVARSNMSKLGSDGKPIYRSDGKVLKGPAYSKPDLHSILVAYLKKKEDQAEIDFENAD